MNDDYERFIRPNLVLLTEKIDTSDLIRHLADVLTRTDIVSTHSLKFIFDTEKLKLIIFIV